MTGTKNVNNKRKRAIPTAEDQDDGQQNDASGSDEHAPKLQKTKPKRNASGTKKTQQAPTQPKHPEVDTAVPSPEPGPRRSSRITDEYATAKGGTAIARSSGPKSLASAAKPRSDRPEAKKSTSSSSAQAAPRSEESVASSDDGVMIVLHKSSPTPEEPYAGESDGDAVNTNEIDDDSDTIVVAVRPRNSAKNVQNSSVSPGTFERREAQTSSLADGTTQQVEDPAESKYRNMRRNHESGLSSFKKWQGGGSYRADARTTTSLMTVPSTSTVQSSSGVAAESATVEQRAQLPRRSSRFRPVRATAG
ncbi:hypothetical protein LTR97_012189 [Elasticomyces elasticus]|uniref:Uncharacterized protein n=1 Tax=Elasticomyces elasticus TaxID=574655 RepID=A0AAN7ZVA3_9PEZI|nr:hypothetical protein LTR97_012189 [Elasticomyces elasticus]